MKNRIWIHNPATLEKRMVCKNYPIPDGFIIGYGSKK
jgi:hypothetical protein